MKKAVVLLVLLVSLSALFSSVIEMKTLANGMKVVVKQNTQNPTVGVFCIVKTGSMLEGKYLGSGISHYVEHIVSGGSTSRRSEKDYMEIDKLIGSNSNAYTSLDRTVYHNVVGKEHFSTALGSIAEYVQFCVFDSAQVAREKQVISKEIILEMAQPHSKLYNRFEESSMSKSTTVHPVIGKPELFNRLTRQDLVNYYQARYVPNNMVLVIVGDIEPQAAMQEVERSFSGFTRGFLEPVYQPGQDVILGTREVIEEFDVLQPSVFISQQIPVGDFRDAHLLNVVCELLLNKESCPIQKKLQQDLMLVRYIYGFSSIYRLENSANFNIRFEAARTEDIPRILELFYKEFSGSKRKTFITQKMLDKLIGQYERDMYLKSRAVEDECEAIGDDMLEYGIPNADHIRMEVLRSIKPAELNAVIRKYLNPQNKFTFYGLPRGEKALMKSSPGASYAKTELTRIDLGNHLSLIHKQNSEYPIVRVHIYIPVSSYYETVENRRIINCMAYLLGQGSKKYSKDAISDWLDEHSASLDFYNDTDGLNIVFSCMTSDVPQILKMIRDAIKNPKFSEAELNLLKSDWEGLALRMQSDADNVHKDFRAAKVYASARERLGNLDEAEISSRFTRQDVLRAYKKYLKAESMIVAIVGDQTAAQASELAKTLYAAFDHSRIEDTIKLPVLGLKNSRYIQEYGFEHAFVDFTMAAPGTDDPDYIVLKTIEVLLNYSDRRLHYATRVERDLAYYASAYSVAVPGYGMFRVSSQSSVDRIEELTMVLEHEIKRLINEPVPAQELAEALENFLMQHRNSITDEWLAYFAIDSEVKGLGYDFLIKGGSNMKQVSPEDIQRVAGKYLLIRDVTTSIPSADVEMIMH